MSSIIDNRDGNTLLHGLQLMSKDGRALRVATAFFSLDALLLLADTLAEYESVRILFGDDASAQERRRLLEMLRQRSDADLLAQREALPNLSPLRKVEALFQAGRVEARCYTAQKFHAKAYLVERPAIYPPRLGVIGSGNFTRPGLCQNIELNVQLTPEQVEQLADWFEARWAEAQADVVTADVLAEIRRQIDLYDPWVLYLKALATWGAQQEADTPGGERTRLLDALDPHQEQGYRRALKILEREHGVMVCDGVGLGKSFIALALMEHSCRQGKNVLLVAPKNILKTSWEGYLEAFLRRYRQPFGSIYEVAMTEFGFDADGADEDEEPEKVREKRELVRALYERADVVVIDESHNFRTSSADRYRNLFRIMGTYSGRRKETILLTATPINTAYRDISNQLALATHEKGNLGGYTIEQIRRYAAELDKNKPVASAAPQLSLGLMDTSSEALNRVLASVVIQRSRATCKALAEAAGRVVRFPRRSDPRCIEVRIGPESEAYRDLIKLADRRFRPGVEFLKQMRAALKKAEDTGRDVLPVALTRGAPRGIKLAAFLTEQYRRTPIEGRKSYQDEVHLAGLVFANTLKQLESSPVAFQGILQSLGLGLIARLRHVFGDAAMGDIAPHEGWIRTPLFAVPEAEVDDDPDIEVDDGDALDASGDEADEWLAHAVRARHLARKLKDFTPELFDTERWRQDILADLGFLKEIHAAALAARKQPDPKLSCVLPALRKLLDAGKRVLLFTQSQRTAEYLERELKARLGGKTVARIDSRVEKTRAAILHAFCPGYNAPAFASSVPKRLDVLISTDVLSEGVNLQEAGAILSYDIHWNPVRLIQRIGRVDRRLDPEKTPEDHAFDIVNVLPPDEINDIIHLVGAVEDRTLRISKALGLDVAFFKTDDPAGNLKEFNATYEGDIPKGEQALTAYARLAVDPPDAATQRVLDALPPGAFGVWAGAPRDGLFALFTMEPKPSASAADRERFAAVAGRPVLALEQPGHATTYDAGEILTLLAGTKPGARSGTPSDEAALAQRLRKLRDGVRQQFAEVGLPKTFLPKLVCWMELRAGKAG